jgi:hypothetical protein
VQGHDLILGLVALGKDLLGATPNQPTPIFSGDTALVSLIAMVPQWLLLSAGESPSRVWACYLLR